MGAAPQHHLGTAAHHNVGVVAREPHSRPIPATAWGWSRVSRTRLAIPAAPPLPGSLPRANRAPRPDGARCPGRRSAGGARRGGGAPCAARGAPPLRFGQPPGGGRTAPLTGATERGCAAPVVVLAFPARASPAAGVPGIRPPVRQDVAGSAPPPDASALHGPLRGRYHGRRAGPSPGAPPSYFSAPCAFSASGMPARRRGRAAPTPGRSRSWWRRRASSVCARRGW